MGNLIGAALSIAWECAKVIASVIINGFGACGSLGTYRTESINVYCFEYGNIFIPTTPLLILIRSEACQCYSTITLTMK